MPGIKSHLSLSENAISLLSAIPGSTLDMVCANEMVVDQGAGETAMMPELFLYATGDSGPLQCSLTETVVSGMPVIQALDVRMAHEVTLHNGRWLLPSWFVIRKIEVWAERVQDNTGPENLESISENTLLFSSESGLELLIRPDHPGPGFLLSMDAQEIEQVLGSGRYFLKHVLD